MGDAHRFCVVLGVTGSIAAYKSAELIRKLRALRDPRHPQGRVDVRVVLTAHGAQFITPVTLQTLSGHPVQQDLFSEVAEWDVEHIGLADDADLLLIAPATANIIAKLSTGLADDLLSSVALACTAPLLIAPAMNVHMWQHPATQQHVRVLRERGVIFIGPECGELACGYDGNGRLVNLDEIVAEVEQRFLLRAAAETLPPPELPGEGDLAERHVVITAGPTREYLDPVRYLSNPSSGKMGYALARAAHERGARVTLVSGPVELAPPPGVERIAVTSSAEMAEVVLRLASEADIIIGAAAPADFTPATVVEHKVKKQHFSGVVQLVPTTDILAEVGKHKRPGQIIVAFAAETERLEEHALEKMARKHADLVVANDVTEPDAGFGADTNRAILLAADGRREELPLQTKDTMAHAILDAVARML